MVRRKPCRPVQALDPRYSQRGTSRSTPDVYGPPNPRGRTIRMRRLRRPLLPGLCSEAAPAATRPSGQHAHQARRHHASAVRIYSALPYGRISPHRIPLEGLNGARVVTAHPCDGGGAPTARQSNGQRALEPLFVTVPGPTPPGHVTEVHATVDQRHMTIVRRRLAYDRGSLAKAHHLVVDGRRRETVRARYADMERYSARCRAPTDATTPRSAPPVGPTQKPIPTSALVSRDERAPPRKAFDARSPTTITGWSSQDRG